MAKTAFKEGRLEEAAGFTAKAAVMKLELNSSWGKDLQKPYYDEVVLLSEEALAEEMKSTYCKITYFTKFTGDKCSLVHKTKPKVPSSRAHIAAEVLGRSKYIMSQFLCLAEELKIECLYTDTDCVIIDGTKYDLLRDEFKKKYHYELDGTKYEKANPPGTLHPELPDNLTHITEFICPGKKVYYALCAKKDGGFQEVYKFKGMSDPYTTIPRYCEREGITIRDFYLSLLAGKKHSVDQVYLHSRPAFERCSETWKYTSRDEVVKEFHFPN